MFLNITIFANTADNIYKAKCASCHALKGMQKDMKAPPMPMVSMRLKKMIDSKDEFISFVKDYIQNPSQEKGFCMPTAYKRFGVMPAIGKTMTQEEIQSIAQWLYDDFKGNWGKSKDSKTCDKKNKMKKMKCGAGKCGGAPKCGAVKIPTH